MAFAGLKKWVLAGISLALNSVAARQTPGATLSLAWNPSTSSDVVDYRLYYSTIPNGWSIDDSYRVGNKTNFSVTNLTAGTKYYFAVTAINAVGLESDFSASTAGVGPASSRPSVTGVLTGTGTLEVVVQGLPASTYLVEQSEDLRQWSTVVNAASDSQGRLSVRSEMDRPRRFFRVRQQ